MQRLKVPGGYVSEISLGELRDVYSQAPSEENARYWKNQAFPEKQIESKANPKKWFGGIGSSQEAVALVEKGWAKGAERLKGLSEEVKAQIPAAESRRRKPVWADDGHTLDVDRAIAGDWDNAYRTVRRTWGKGPQTVDLVVAWGGNCTMTPEQLFWCGATMLVISDILEDASYSVRLTAALPMGAGGTDEMSLHKMLIKDHGDPLTIDALAGTLCHAGVFRSLGFAQICWAPWDVGPGLGFVRSLREWNRKMMGTEHEIVEGDGTVMVGHAYSEGDAKREIIRVVRAAQCLEEIQED